jgi:polyisoprenyl-phosphate glycosyltransferase
VSDSSATVLDVVILIPVYNDWESAQLMLADLDTRLTEVPARIRVVIVDDRSSSPLPDGWPTPLPQNVALIERLRLRRNLGHQRAIAIGLSFVQAERPCDAVLVMDCDGEDKPEDVPRLIAAFRAEQGRKVIFAERIRRSEDMLFRIGYHSYRALHRVLTGIPVRVGNFCIIPAAHLETLVVTSDIWNHFVAAVFKTRVPHRTIQASRGRRLAGESKMDLVALISHGLSAISVFAETVGVRLSLAILAFVGVLVLLLGTVVAVRWGTELAIPGWATSAGGLLLVIVFQMLTVVLALTLVVLFNRNNFSFLPVRDYKYFVGPIQNVYDGSG